MEYISVAPTLTLLIAIFWIIFAPIFFYKIFQPRWECHGFESTMAHEVGHVLGFHHPDAEWRHNLRADAPMSSQRRRADARTQELDHVSLTAVPGATSAADDDVRDSIMFSVTQHRDKTCLSPDDLEGLNYLYPTCEGAFTPLEATGQPLCIKARRLSGWLRLLFSASVPFFAASGLIVLIQMWVRHQQRKHRVSLEATALRLRAQREELIGKMKEGARKAARGGATPRNAGSGRFNLRRSLTRRTPRARTGSPDQSPGNSGHNQNNCGGLGTVQESPSAPPPGTAGAIGQRPQIGGGGVGNVSTRSALMRERGSAKRLAPCAAARAG